MGGGAGVGLQDGGWDCRMGGGAAGWEVGLG